jgi:hypothetical protein
MKYTDIDKVNGEIKMLDLKGKNYAMVPERVTAFRKLFPDGFITTEIINLSDDGTVVIMKSEAGYYREDGSRVVLGSGIAKEVQGKGMVNGTSHIENCETSAVGRALGMIGLGLNGGGICSAEELVNAITAQKQMQEENPMQGTGQAEKGQNRGEKHGSKAKVDVETTNKVPQASEKQEEPQEVSPVKAFLFAEMKAMREARKISPAKNNKLFTDQWNALIAAGFAPKKKLDEYTMPEAESLIKMMYEKFDPEGTEIKA